MKRVHQLSIACGNSSRHAKDRGAGVVKAHREKYIVALHPHIASMGVRKRIRPAMTNMLGRVWIRIGYCHKIFFSATVRVLLKDPLILPPVDPLALYRIPVYTGAHSYLATSSASRSASFILSFDLPPPCPKRLSPPPEPPSLLDTCLAITLALTFLHAASPANTITLMPCPFDRRAR